MSIAAKKANEMLNRAIKYVCLVYNVLFQGLVEAMKQSGENKFERVQALICHLPYNTRWMALLSYLEHERLSQQYMSSFVELHSAVMDGCTQRHLFCSALQFKTGYEMWIGEVKDVLKGE